MSVFFNLPDPLCSCPLQDVLNILPEKNDGGRHVINVYTLDDCVSIMFSDEQVRVIILMIN